MTKDNIRKILLLVLLIPFFEFRIIHVYAWEVDETSQVTNIVDGDTFDIATGDRIRFADINAPKINASGGPEAREYLRKLIFGKTVYLDVDDVFVYDFNGTGKRLVCVVFIKHNSTKRLNVNEKLVREGHAEYYRARALRLFS